MRPGYFKALMLALGFYCAGQAIAMELNSQPGIIGKDDRVPVERNEAPWQAIGQVNIGGYRMRWLCSGTLVAPRVVLTAAHCVMNVQTRQPFRLDNIHFSAGVFRDQSLGLAKAQCVEFPQGYKYVGPQRLLPDLPIQSVQRESLRKDWALIVLDKAIAGVEPVPIAGDAPLSPGTPVSHASYPITRRFILSVQRNCHVLANEGDLVTTDCDSHIGSSGGPLLIEGKNGMEVAGVLSGLIENTASVFVPLPSWKDIAAHAACVGLSAE